MSQSDRRRTVALRRVPTYALLTAVALLFLGPVFWMISASLKSINEVLRYPPTIIPEIFQWGNYAQVFTLQPFGRQFANSVLVMVLVVAVTLTIAVPAGYALARVRPVGAAAIFIVLLSGVFIPPEAVIVPLFQAAADIGWVDSFAPLVLFTAVLSTAPVAMFIMRQAFLTLPNEFEEAAVLDGANRWRTMVQIFLPLVRPSIASAVVFTAWFSWNQFLEPLVYLRSQEMLTVPVALTLFEDPLAGPRWHVQMAATTISVVPVLIVFLIAQRHVVSGLTAGGLKS
ncbi:MAG TPA: carbohydrate ABC transporter permease [Candidatus Agrococcus pullicola]|uniref:Carbohydrate ABC transporter permease n=1 Tax=Candidatus Agrococcus pullicola TaxID=2838429 RepID=A0A9D1YVQ3_9MICO|nr:carbohydrate ABC transporter permease [Candidatus Agrococcus pullicola]